jgi:hypothetical protein
LDEHAQFESETTISIPLTQPWGTKGVVHVSPSEIASAFGGASPSGSVKFTISADSLSLFSSATGIRVTGIGLAVESSPDAASPVQFAQNFPHTPTNPPPKQGETPPPNPEPTQDQVNFTRNFESLRLARLNATISSPGQAMADGTPYTRPPMFLSNVRIYGGSSGDQEATLSYDPPIRGLNPLGDWSVKFDPNVVAFYQSAAAITDAWVTGLVLHLRVRASIG